MATRVLLLTQWFDPEPTFKGMVFARELVQQGFEVEVLTGFPNYPEGKIYSGYKIKWLQRELIDGVHISRVPLYPNHDHSAMKRVLNYISFSASSLVYGLFLAKRADVIYAYHPPLTVGVTAGLLRLLRRIPVVYDIQDMWPDTLRATGMLNNPRILSVVDSVCRWVYKHVDHIVVLSPGFKRLLIDRGVPESKLEVIYNWANEEALNAPQGCVSQEIAMNDGDFQILFAGNMGKAQALDTVLDAALLLQERGSRVRWVMLGGGVEVSRLKQRAENMKLSNIKFLPAVPMSEVGAYLNTANALLVHLRKDPLFEVTIPSKTQAYMAVGKPVLMAVNGDAADLVFHSDAGMVAESENPESLANAADKMASLKNEELNAMGERAKNYYKQNLALQVGVGRFGVIFQRLAEKLRK